jgi:tetratricopeptide (TPR) repeat protein
LIAGIAHCHFRTVPMTISSMARIALIGLIAAFATPAHAAKLYFGTQEYLREIQAVDVVGPKGEPLYLGYKYSFHSFILPYRLTDDGYVLGVTGQQAFFRLDDARIKSMQASGQLPTPLPPYQLSVLDYAMGHGAWIALVVIIALIPLSMRSKRRRKRAMPHFEDGIARHQAGDLSGAAESYSKAVEVDQKFAAALHFRGKARAGLGDLKAGISDHTKAIRIDPKFADALMDRGLLLHGSGNLDGAISDFSRVIKLNKKDANAYYHRGLSYLAKNDFRRAIADFTKTIEAAPDFADGYRQRALAYHKSGDVQHARADQEAAHAIAGARPAT